jgi:phospholipid/cholesterol/gamma-HCH transport system substrate-binding protein
VQAASDPTGKDPSGSDATDDPTAPLDPARAEDAPATEVAYPATPSRYRRFAAVGSLAAAAVIVVALLFRGGDDGHEYNLIFENGSQLVAGNEVMIGGVPAGSITDVERTDDNLARVSIHVDQQLHEGTTAAARYTSLIGIANRIISLEPGPNSSPALAEGSTLGLTSTTTPVEIDQLFNTFKPRVRQGLQDVIQGFGNTYAGNGPNANDSYKYFDPALYQTDKFLQEFNSDEAMFERFVVSTSQLVTAVGSRSDELSSSITHAKTAFGSIAGETRSLDRALAALPDAFRQSNTTFVNLRAALDDVDPLVETSKTATKDLAPYLKNDLRPVIRRAVPVFKDFSLVVNRNGDANDANELLRSLPKVRPRTDKSFAQSEDAIADFQPTLNFARAYTPEFLQTLTKLGQITAYYDANGHYARVMPSNLNLFEWNNGTSELDPITPAQQYDSFGPLQLFVRCPGAATQSAPDLSNPFVNPPWPESGLDPTDCTPTDVPPGP